MNAELPQRLYKYRTVATDRDLARVAEIMRDGKLYLASPNQYNDLFECGFSLSLEATPEQMRQKFADILIGEGLNKSQAFAQATKLVSGPHRDTVTVARELIEKVGNTLGLLSLTSVNDDLLMWAHYADAHRGICLEFDTATDKHLIGAAMPVRYEQDFPVLDFFKTDAFEVGYTVALTKSVTWSYEQEWRTLKPDLGRTKAPFPPEALTGIVLGARMEYQRRRAILELADSLPHEIVIREASVHTDKYSLRIDALA